MGGRSLTAVASRSDLGRASGVDALTAREVDGLVSKLLTEVKIPFPSLGKRVLGHLADLKTVLSTDYADTAALPEKPLLKELSRIVEDDIKAPMSNWGGTASKPWADPVFIEHVTKMFDGREIEVRAEPYLEGAGMALRGFFCRAALGDRSKFVIFLNTAHHPAAVVATFGHEIGHYIYGSLVSDHSRMAAFLEGTFSNHLNETDELFADSLVALSAYSRDLIKAIGPLHRVQPGKSEELFSRIRKAYGLIGPKLGLDLSKEKIGNVWRVRYLTSMTHFFKLRCAITQVADL